MTTSPFDISRAIGNNLSQGVREYKDETLIEKILAQTADDPEAMQGAIGTILSKVSPERQGPAIQYLQNAYNTIAKKKQQAEQEAKERKTAEEAGYTYGVPPQVAATQVKAKEEQKLLQGLGIGLGPQQPEAVQNFGLAAAGGDAVSSVAPVVGGMVVAPTDQTQQPKQQTSKTIKDLSDDQLIPLMSVKVLQKPIEQELKRRQEERKLVQKEKEGWTKFGMDRAKKVLDQADEIANELPVKKTALKLMVDSIANKDMSFWTLDNLAEATGVEGLRSPEGALFKTSGKEYFLGSISRAGARPNQWIEQQIADMMTKVGRSTEANLSVSRALQNELDIDEERVRLTNDLFDELKSQGKDVGNLGPLVNKKLSVFAENKQNELFNDLRAIKAIGEGKVQKYHKVAEGTIISPYMVDALLSAFNNDPEKAQNEAKKLGYTVE